MANERDNKEYGQAEESQSHSSDSEATSGLPDQIRTNPALRARYARAKARRAAAHRSGVAPEGNVSGHVGQTAIDHQPGAEATEADWTHYLLDLHGFLRDQTGAEKEQLLDLQRLREEHPVVGSMSETTASLKALRQLRMPDEEIWDRVFAELNRAHSLLAGEHANLEAAKAALASAVRLFHDAHRQQYEYRSRVEGGAETTANVLRGVEVACDITLTLLSAGVGAAGANALKLGARSVFKLAIEQAAKSGLAKTGLKAAVVGGINKLAQGAAEQGTAKAIGADGQFDLDKVLRDAGEAAVMNLLGVLVGGALSKTFMRALGRVLGSRMPPNAIAELAAKYGFHGDVIPPELFVTKGWRFLVGIAGDACTTTLLTALSVVVEHLRSGGKRPSGEQFAAMVVEQMIRNGLLQILFGAIHSHATTHGEEGHAGAHDRGGGVGVQRGAQELPNKSMAQSHVDPPHHQATKEPSAATAAKEPAAELSTKGSTVTASTNTEKASSAGLPVHAESTDAPTKTEAVTSTSATQAPDRATLAEGPRKRVDAPVAGLYDSLYGSPAKEEVNLKVGGLVFTDEVLSTFSDGTPKRISTLVRVDGHGQTQGEVIRSVKIGKDGAKTLVLEEAFLDGIPKEHSWVTDDGKALVPGRGIPLQTYMTIRQMKILGIEYGDLGKPNFKTVKMSTIVNQRTIWELAEQCKKHPAMSDAERLRHTHSVKYAETSIIQAGARIVEARVENGTTTTAGEYAADKGGMDELAKRGLSPSDPVRKYFDIILTVAPFEPKPNIPSEVGDK